MNMVLMNGQPTGAFSREHRLAKRWSADVDLPDRSLSLSLPQIVRMPRIIRPSTSPPMETFDPYRSPSSLTQFFNSKAPSTLKSVPEMLFSLNGLFQRTKPNKKRFSSPPLMPCIFHPCVHSYFKKPIFHCAVENTSDHTQCN